jgi:hypothetical protein
MLSTRFALLQTAGSVPDTVTGPAGAATLQPEIYGPVLDALADGDYVPKSLRHLLDLVPSLPYGDMEQAINVLIGMGAVAPCQSEAAEKLVQARCNSLNLQLCKRSLYGPKVQVLVSPVTGGGLVVSRIQQLFLISIKQGKRHPAEWALLAWGIIGGQGEGLLKDGRALTTAEENLAELTEQAEAFAEGSLVILKALKVA